MNLNETLCTARRRAVSWLALILLTMSSSIFIGALGAQGVSTTTVQGTVYLANGQPGAGTLTVRWPAFTTASGQAVVAGNLTVKIGADGFVSVNLAPNQGSVPGGEYYTAVFYMSDGSTSTEYWVVPSAASATPAQVRAQVMPATQAVQAVSKTYVDQAISKVSQSALTTSGGTLTQPLYLNADPTQPMQAADKHYVDAQVATTMPLTGGTLTGSLNGTDASFSGKVVAATILGNVNGVITATAYGAVGDCKNSGSTSACTDNYVALSNAINAAYSSHLAVFLPQNPSASWQTTYYTSQPIDTKGVTIYGPLGGGGMVNVGGAAYPVSIRGGVGQDVLRIGTNYYPTYTIRDLNIIVDDSVDSSASFPNRRPGRVCKDASMNGLDGILTSSTQCKFMPGDVGQAVTVAGAGSGGAMLTTTIASYQSATQVTLVASSVTAVTNATAYVSVNGLPVSQNIGNCGFAVDDANATRSTGNNFVQFSNVMFQTTNGIGNYTCGIFEQANAAPYHSVFSNLGFAWPTFSMAFVPSPNVAADGTKYGGMGDHNIFENIWFGGRHSLIVYDGGDNTIRDSQVSGFAYGPTIINYNGVRGFADNWHIDIPEVEANGQHCTSTATSLRIAGSKFTINRFGDSMYCPEKINLQWDASISSAQVLFMGSSYANFNITGDVNRITYTDGAPTNLNNTGYGNDIRAKSYTNFGNSLSAREVMGGGIGGNPPAFPMRADPALNQRGDFLFRGAANFYFNDNDLVLWPFEVAYSSGPPALQQDATSDSGWDLVLNGTSGFTALASNGAAWTIGKQFPAGKMRVYVKIKGSTSIAGWYFTVYANNGSTNVCTKTGLSLTTSWQVFSCDIDVSSYAGTTMRINLAPPGAGTQAYVSWIGFRPFDTDTTTTSLMLGYGTTPLTLNKGTGNTLQRNDGTGTAGNLVKFGANGDTTNGPAPPAGAIVGTTDTQTLTNKSIAGSEINSGTVGTAYGGTGVSTASSTGVAQVSAGTWSVSTSLANGTTATTQTQGDNSTKVATTAYVDAGLTTKAPLASPTFTGTVTTGGNVVVPVNSWVQASGNAGVQLGATGCLGSSGACKATWDSGGNLTANGIVTGGNDSTRTTSVTITNAWTTTGLVLPSVGVNTTKTGHCTIYWQMSSTSYTATFGLGMNNAPTNVWGATRVISAATGTQNYLSFTQAATATTAISAATTAGATSTTYEALIDFTLQTGATNPVAMTVYGQTSNSGATLTVMPGSTCYWLP